MGFFNLHQHTTYSFLDGYGTPAQYLKRMQDLDQPGMALTDHGNIFAHHPFEKEWRGSDKHLAYGCEFYAVEELKRERGYFHVTVLAKTNEGYGNLLKLVNLSNQQFYYKPRISYDQLFMYSKGLVILSGCCCDGWLIKNGLSETEAWKMWCHKLKDAEWYVELQPFEDEKEKWERLTYQAQKRGLPCLVTVDAHYPSPDEKEVQDFQLAINTSRPKSDPDRLKMEYPLWIPTVEELEERCKGMGAYKPEWISNTIEVGLSCQVELPKSCMVKVNAKISTLKKRCRKRLKELGKDKEKAYQDRLNRELELVESKGFTDYFEIVSEMTLWAKERMLVGPGRGSSAGSLVCYLLRITEVDPIKFGTLFERFIDFNRTDLPDIDIDFPPAQRDDVIDHIREKYGEEHTAQLVTFSTYKPRGVIQDGARVLGIPRWEAQDATSQIVERSGGDARATFCLEDSIKQYGKLSALFKKNPGLWDAVKLEGQTRQTGLHAAAVILSGKPLGEIGSISRDGAFGINKYLLEEYGLLKIDVLGLENLSIVMDICEAVGVDYNDFYSLPLDDELTFQDVFIPGKLLGVFQFEGYSVGRVSRKLQPSTFDQLVHITALGRPGPLNSGMSWEYIDRAKGKKYDILPSLKEYTQDTLGCIIFQEQVMNVVKNIGNFSWADTQIIRGGMSKSKGEEFFNQYSKQFIEGAKTHGLTEQQAREIWDQIYTHGSWSFNLSHAVSYAIISYWIGYCKAHYPGEFYARMLRYEDDENKIRQYLKEWGGPFVAFDLNLSKTHWRHEDGVLYGGITNIHGIGEKQAPKIEAGQPYESADEARSRLAKGVMGKIDLVLTEGQRWADLRSLRERVEGHLDRIELSRVLNTLQELKNKTGRNFLTLGRVAFVSLRDHNESDRVIKRGYKMDSPTEYIVLTLEDGEADEIFRLFVDRYLVEKHKEEIMSLTNKICLFRVKKEEEGNSLLGCVKFKVLEEV